VYYDRLTPTTGDQCRAAHGFLRRESVVVVVGNYIFCHMINEVSDILGMHLGLCDLRRSHVAPISDNSLRGFPTTCTYV